MKDLALIRSRKGYGIVGLIILFAIFLVMWFIFLSDFIADLGASIVINNGLTGVEAFAFAQLNFIIFIVVILAIMGFGYFSLEQ
jgi:hypothetical protein